MTAAQKTAKDKFKKAIAYRQKTGVSLKDAFAHIYGKKVGAVKKKAAPKKKAAKKVTGIKQDKRFQAKKPGKRTSESGNIYYERRPNRSDKGKLLGIYNIGELFDITAIKDLDALKKQYIKLSKKYHPDAGGTTIQFQQLQNEYNILLNKILNNSQLNQSQKQNEKDLDLAIREIVDNLVNIDGLNVELIGKWLWISGNTYPVKTILKQAGLTFIKKEGNPFWVYKGVESTSRGQSSMEEIRKKYGVYKIEVPKFKKIGVIVRFNKTKLKSAINKAKNALDKRPV
ncbi:MAG: hypothetical protein EBU61_00075 [Crocinitomicaceae bacterium]|nr:hypothetical protein [Crocinitomicaceae bacterium]